MSYEIVRLLVLDWPAAVEALRARGVDFYWGERDEDTLEIQEEKIPFVRSYHGPLANCPAWRDPEASWVYECIRKHLGEENRAICDDCFARLFWDDEHDSRLRDLFGRCKAVRDIWYALAPTTVAELLAKMHELPLQALETAAAAACWESEYLPTFADFEHHLHNHMDLLKYAAKRQAGLLGLISA